MQPLLNMRDEESGRNCISTGSEDRITSSRRNVCITFPNCETSVLEPKYLPIYIYIFFYYVLYYRFYFIKPLMFLVNNFCKKKHAGQFTQRTAICSGYDVIRLIQFLHHTEISHCRCFCFLPPE